MRTYLHTGHMERITFRPSCVINIFSLSLSLWSYWRRTNSSLYYDCYYSHVVCLSSASVRCTSLCNTIFYHQEWPRLVILRPMAHCQIRVTFAQYNRPDTQTGQLFAFGKLLLPSGRQNNLLGSFCQRARVDLLSGLSLKGICNRHCDLGAINRWAKRGNKTTRSMSDAANPLENTCGGA